MEEKIVEEEQLPQKSEKTMSDDEVIKIRKDKIINFFKTSHKWLVYVILAVITYLTVKIRTSNLAGLKDITTGSWTLGPDLDPFLFLRWAKYIAEHGSLMAVDMMRYVPLGYNTSGELVLHSYLIVWFHKIAAFFGSESITQSAVLYPAFMFGLTVIAFFFMTRKIFLDNLGEKKADIVALIASFFLSVIPSLLPRTIAGIPEKESSGLLFMFLAFYFFISSWKAKKNITQYLNAFLAGVSTALMGLVWGGYTYIFVTIGGAAFIAFILGKFDKKKAYTYGIWLAVSVSLLLLFTDRYSLIDLTTSTTTGFSFFVLFLALFDFILFNTKLKKYFKEGKISCIPRPIISFIIFLFIGIIVISILQGPGFVPNKIITLRNILVTPVADRLNLTVAENRQPFFREWGANFGPHIKEIAITFWLFFIGSIYLFYNSIDTFKKKDRIFATFAYLIFLCGLIFSRYNASSRLNGTNSISLAFYALGFVIFVASVGFYYRKYYLLNEEERLSKIDFSLIFVLVFFLISLISARGAVRLIMMLVPSASIMVGYFAVVSFSNAQKAKDSVLKFVALVIAVVVIMSVVLAGYKFYGEIKATAQGYVPSIYTQQWQKAMAWVRDNTPENAVFGHWWDYGYWLQSIGERATVLDGGNAIGYWNYLMGRYALTGTNNTQALEFLYAHNTTHFLIDSTDIGKYSAFSSIGSDISYDRASYIPAFRTDLRQTQEKKNSSVFVYVGGTGLDEDIIYEENGTRIFLPAGKSGLGAILVEKDSPVGEVISQPIGIFMYQGQQYNVPFRYLFDGEFRDFESGIEAGIFLMPAAISNGNNIQIEKDGALLYLSKRTVKSQLARLYLYKEDNPYFKLVHSEDDFFVAQIKAQNPGFDSDFIYFQGIRGPIRIWEIDYPEDMQINSEYLELNFRGINLLEKA